MLRVVKKEALHLGEVIVSIKVENASDSPSGKVRSAILDALVDTGATLLALPREVVDQLGLQTFDSMPVSYADERTDVLDVAGPVRLTIQNITRDMSCLILPNGSQPLVGQIPLEMMNIVVDCPRERIVRLPSIRVVGEQ